MVLLVPVRRYLHSPRERPARATNIWWDSGVRGGALVVGVTVVASEAVRLWLKVAFTK